MLARMWRKGNPCALVLGMQIGAATIETSMEVPQKIKTRTTILSGNSALEIYPKVTKSLSQRYLHLHIHCSIIYNSQDMETT